MTDKDELIKAAETLKQYCDDMSLYSYCGKCPLENICDSIDYHVVDRLAEMMKDIAHELRYSDE